MGAGLGPLEYLIAILIFILYNPTVYILLFLGIAMFWFRLKLWKQVVISMVLACVFGIFFPEEAVACKGLGTVYMNAIKMVVVPLIFFCILNGVTNMTDVKTFGRIGRRAVAAYGFTTMFAVIIGFVAANIFDPGADITLHMEGARTHSSTTLSSLFLNIIPSNPIKAMAEANTVQIVVFAFFNGIALIMVGDKAKPLKNVIIAVNHVVFKMIEIVIQFTPYGVFSLMAWVVGTYGIEVVLSLGRFVLVVLGALFLQYILFGFMLLVFAGLNPIPFYKKMANTQLLAFATSSSKATLGTATEDLRQKMGVSNLSSSFILPLGASMNMDATAIYLGICVVFFASVFGINLTASDYLIATVTCTIGSIGAAGFPGGSLVMMSTVLSAVGIPLEGISLVLGIDRILEMFRTTINITGDCTITVMVDKWEKMLNKKVYYSDVPEEDPEDDRV